MNEHMIAVGEFENGSDPEIVRGHLKSAAIDATLSRNKAGGMLPSLQETDGVSVLVLPGDEKKAGAILHEKSMLKR